MRGSIDAWFYKYIVGIQVDENYPAFSSFVVKPALLENLGSAKASVETIRGTISSQWEIHSGILTLNVEVPFNTTATVYMPCKENSEIKSDGKPLKTVDGMVLMGTIDGAQRLKIHSGKYSFTTSIH